MKVLQAMPSPCLTQLPLFELMSKSGTEYMLLCDMDDQEPEILLLSQFV